MRGQGPLRWHVGDGEERGLEVNPGYALGQLERALATAETHEDPETRQRAAKRFEKWEAVLRGMAAGALRIGSREPVAGLPSWVTPEVARGGFATGAPAAGGPLSVAERATADAVGLPDSREALFAWFLTEPGLQRLSDMLSKTNYRVDLPEEAALLVTAWLGRTGHTDTAVRLVNDIASFADRLRFSPVPTTEPLGDLDIVFRESVGDVSDALTRRRENKRVEAQRQIPRPTGTTADGYHDESAAEEHVRRPAYRVLVKHFAAGAAKSVLQRGSGTCERASFVTTRIARMTRSGCPRFVITRCGL